VEKITIEGCSFFENMKGTIFGQISQRLQGRLVELRIVDTIIDKGNIGVICDMVRESSQ
jgi:hypothetical protein